MYAKNLADRALHLATMTMQLAKDWSDASYVLEVFGPSSCIMRLIPYLDMSEEYIFDNSIRAACWVKLQNDAIVVRSEDDDHTVFIRMNYKKTVESILFGMPAYHETKKKADNLSDKLSDTPSKSPTSVIPEDSAPIQNSAPMKIVRPIPHKLYEHRIPRQF